ncbi:helix-turn-helix domain-containing protein [Solibacillus silvestris]|uniref:helix-turn-helix domain-containing protein n=1 Tax=Solibacillus silvestris TaxID=76853 RepID=UPI003F7EBEF2
MINIGEKIKQLRKERKMTLAQVAGTRLSKGMLSLIENGKAQPSMESLQHIAKQLGIDVAELMQSKDTQEVKEFYLKIESLAAQLNKLYEEADHREKSGEIYTLIGPYIAGNKLNGSTYEEIRLTELYYLMRHYLDITPNMDGFVQCIERYKQIHVYSKVVSGYRRLGSIEFQVQKYEQSINWMQKGVHCIEQFGAFVGEIEKLDLYYNLTVVYAALNNEEQSEKYLQLALKIAHEEKILYRMNDFYRYLFFIHVMKGEGEKALDYLMKIQAFSVILEDPIDLAIEGLLQLAYWNYIEKAYEKVIATPFNYYDAKGNIKMQLDQFIKGERAFAYYQLRQLDEASELLSDIEGPKLHHHPSDASRLYRSFAIRALCLFEKGDAEKAKRDILYAANGVKDYAPSLDKAFIDEAYAKIM